MEEAKFYIIYAWVISIWIWFVLPCINFIYLKPKFYIYEYQG